MAASTDVEQASVVHIAVSRDEGKYEVAVFPQRVNDITLFFTPCCAGFRSCYGFRDQCV